MKLKIEVLLTGLALLWADQSTFALPSYVSRVPNGSALSCATCHVGGVPPDLNAFGDAFSATHSWSASLASQDSDGDGFTNGQELGDPQGVWKVGAALPIPNAQVSVPGDATSVPTLVPPPISLASPSGGNVGSAPYMGPIVASTTDVPAAIGKIQFFSGSTLLGTVSTSPYSLPVNLPSGSYTLTALAVDYLGASNTSAAVQITVNAAGNPPVISTQPSNQTATVGGTAVFSVVAGGTGPLTYQWLFDSTNITGATLASLSIANVPLSAAGSYRCAVSNSFGGALSQPAQLTVQRSTPRLEAPQVVNKQIVLSGSGFSGHGPIVFLVSSNLTDWTPLATNAPTMGTLSYTNAIPTNAPLEFFRAVEN